MCELIKDPVHKKRSMKEKEKNAWKDIYVLLLLGFSEEILRFI